MAAPAPDRWQLPSHHHGKVTMFHFDHTAARPRRMLLLLCSGLAACAAPVPVPVPVTSGQLVLVNRPLADAVADFNRNSCKQGKHIIVLDPAVGRKTLVGQYPLNAPEMFARDVSALLGVPVNIGQDHIVIGVR
jgi:hypothetical protein